MRVRERRQRECAQRTSRRLASQPKPLLWQAGPAFAKATAGNLRNHQRRRLERSGPPPLVARRKRQATARSRHSAPEFVCAEAEASGPPRATASGGPGDEVPRLMNNRFVRRGRGDDAANLAIEVCLLR